MKRRVRKPMLILAIIILAVSGFFTMKLLSNSFNQPKFLDFGDTKEYIYNDNDNIQFMVEYSNNKKLNKALENGIELVFNDNNDIFENKDKIIDVNFSFNEKINLASWTFVENSENLSEVFATLNYNTTNYEIIPFDKIYGENLKGLAMLTRNALAKDDGLKYNKKVYTKTLPEVENFKFIAFDKDGVQMLFKRDTFDIEAVKTVNYEYQEIMPYFSEAFLDFIDKDYVISDNLSTRYIDPNKPMIAMTFDDGPNPSSSVGLGEYYFDRDARVTYFWLGSRIEQYPDIVTDMHSLGHEIANHSYNHKDFTTLNDEQLNYQTDYVSKLIKEITMQESVLIRAPYGHVNEKVKSKIANPLINWEIDPEDWRVRDSKIIYDNINRYLYDGAIVLLHDLYPTSIEAAINILDNYLDTYQFVTVSEMFAYKGIALNDGELYFSARGR